MIKGHNAFTPAQVLFRQDHFEDASQVQLKDCVRLLPYGMQVEGERGPLLLLRDSSGEHTLAVRLNSLEAGVTLTQSNKSIAPVTPHKVTEALLTAMHVQFTSCLFVGLQGAQQLVQLNLNGANVSSIQVRAEDAMSFCLHMNIPFYATKKYIEHAKMLTTEMVNTNQSLLTNSSVLMARSHKYVM